MSRHTQQNEKYEMAYGRDHMFGLFIQIFERSRINEDDEGLIVNLDEKLEGGIDTPQKICEVAEEYGFYIESPEDTINI